MARLVLRPSLCGSSFGIHLASFVFIYSWIPTEALTKYYVQRRSIGIRRTTRSTRYFPIFPPHMVSTENVLTTYLVISGIAQSQTTRHDTTRHVNACRIGVSKDSRLTIVGIDYSAMRSTVIGRSFLRPFQKRKFCPKQGKTGLH